MPLCRNVFAHLVAISPLGLLVGGAPASAAPPARVTISAEFASPEQFSTDPGGVSAISYDPAAVPFGGRVTVTEALDKWGGMSVMLDLTGVRPRQTYRAYVHVNSCSADPSSAGERLRNGPSPDSYEANEVWIDDTAPAAACVTMPFQRLGGW